MSGIGHNNPPALESHQINIEDLFALISDTVAGAEVKTDEQETALAELLDQIHEAGKAADAARVAETKPLHEAWKDANASWKPLLDRVALAKSTIKKLLTPYRAAKQAAKDAEARKLREEAEARERAAQEAHKAADTMEAKFAAEEEFKSAKKLTAVANKIDRTATGLRTHWEAEILNRRDVLNHYVKTNPDAFVELIQTLADRDARAHVHNVPGVAFHERKDAA